MKVLLVTKEGSLSSQVDKRFGHGAYFIVYDSETGESEVFKNIINDEPQYGVGFFLNKGVNAVVVGNIGPNSFDRLNDEGVEIYVARKMTGKEAVDKIVNRELKPVNEPTMKKSVHEGHHVGSDLDEHYHHHEDEHYHEYRHEHHHEHEHLHGRGLGLGRGVGRGLGRGEGRGLGRGMGRGRGDGRGRR